MSYSIPHRSNSSSSFSFNRPPATSERRGRDIERRLHQLGLLSRHSSRAFHQSLRRSQSQSRAEFHAQSQDYRPHTSNSHFSLGRSASSSYRPTTSRQHSSSSSPADHRAPPSRRPVATLTPQPSFKPPIGDDAMAGVLDLERTRTRRDRTFIGTACAFCEELLQHTLRGERVLQLSCGHVSHEACFYEYLREFDSHCCPVCNAPLGLDATRGGNIVDLEKLGAIVRAKEQQPDQRSVENNQWDSQSAMTEQQSMRRQTQQHSRNHNSQDLDRHSSMDHQSHMNRQSQQERPRYHNRTDSGATGMTSTDYGDSNVQSNRRHDYDVQSMDTSLSSPRATFRSPIAAPTVSIRSEFPTITRSRQQQSITCLVTVEVQEVKWRGDVDEGRPSLESRPTAPARPGIHARTESHQSHQSHQSHHRPKSSSGNRARQETTYEQPEILEEVTELLHSRVDNWHGLDVTRFGKLRLHGQVRVGKDRRSWQELECYLFTEMLICVKEKKTPTPAQWDGPDSREKKTKCALKGSILIKKHLKHVESVPDESILTLSLSVAELPAFHLQFSEKSQLELWKYALMDINSFDQPALAEYDQDNSGTDEEDYKNPRGKRVSSINSSSYGAGRSNATAPTEYTNSRMGMPEARLPPNIHVPLDIVAVIPVSSSMQGLKISVLRDALRFMVSSLGERDRMGLVTFGSSGGGVPVVGLTTKTWGGWSKVLESIRPVGQKSLRADVVEGANVAMDLLMQRKSNNTVSSILLISDSSTSDPDSVDFVVSRAEAAKVAIHSFGLGLTHKPDTMIELSTRTKASYTYVKDWMMLRECVAGILGSLQTTSHQNVKLKLRLPEGSPARFIKISGALQITKRATGRDAEAALGDLRFGDKRDILVQLAIPPDNGSPEQVPQDAWETIVSGLEALGGPLDQDDQRTMSVEEVPLLQADLTFGDIMREGTLSHLPRPSLLAITMLPAISKSRQNNRPVTPPIPPHPSVVQRRMELLTSDMLTRALTLVSRGQHERAHHLLSETRSILKGLGKGSLPPLPPPPGNGRPQTAGAASANGAASTAGSTNGAGRTSPNQSESPERRAPSPPSESSFSPATGIDPTTMRALDAELESSLEWINHPAVFGRDSRKAVLQAIGIISSQRGYTFRSPSESLWAGRIVGVKRLSERSREWREAGDESLTEEA